ncbi:MAG: hypothetical protein ACYSP9_07135 [Planctomycetota bacterium]|jgi:hypothetical protein
MFLRRSAEAKALLIKSTYAEYCLAIHMQYAYSAADSLRRGCLGWARSDAAIARDYLEKYWEAKAEC